MRQSYACGGEEPKGSSARPPFGRLLGLQEGVRPEGAQGAARLHVDETGSSSERASTGSERVAEPQRETGKARGAPTQLNHPRAQLTPEEIKRKEMRKRINLSTRRQSVETRSKPELYAVRVFELAIGESEQHLGTMSGGSWGDLRIVAYEHRLERYDCARYGGASAQYASRGKPVSGLACSARELCTGELEQCPDTAEILDLNDIRAAARGGKGYNVNDTPGKICRFGSAGREAGGNGYRGWRLRVALKVKAEPAVQHCSKRRDERDAAAATRHVWSGTMDQCRGKDELSLNS
ncbi:hypothetical protein B0H13DRAFT_2546591 [Mycena leptocephala]|nr:hypothetical protein B0H13DRAFT_2546591 [Mycena leptocephala]